MDTHYPWMSEETRDTVNHPKHYTTGRIEVADAIDGLGLNFIEGNVVKYLARYRHKHSTPAKQLEDLKKAKWYLDKVIDQYRKDLCRYRPNAGEHSE